MLLHLVAAPRFFREGDHDHFFCLDSSIFMHHGPLDRIHGYPKPETENSD
jgi:hypothetical protein